MHRVVFLALDVRRDVASFVPGLAMTAVKLVGLQLAIQLRFSTVVEVCAFVLGCQTAAM